MHDVFISHASQDKNIADAIINILETRRIKCWIAYRDAVAGDDYAGSIVRAIKNSKACVLIFSSESNQSKHVFNEVNSCVNYGKVIIPFRIVDVLMHETLEYYLSRTHWLDALTYPLEEHINKLADRLDGLLNSKPIEVNTNVNTSSIYNNITLQEPHMVKYNELIKLGYNADKIAIQLVENDYINYNGIGEDNEGSPAQWAQILQNSSDSFQYMLNAESKIIGDWSIVALKEDDFIEAKKGQLLEKDISYDNCDIIAFPGVYYGYILVFSCLPDYRNMKNYMLLMNSFYKQMEEYAENGIFFKEWCMNVFTPEIENIMKKLGFSFLVNNKSFGKIYHQTFIPLPNNPIIDKFDRLKQLYAEII
jgi:hypothetical protein